MANLQLTTRTRKKKQNFENLMAKAENSNPFLWNCTLEISSDGKGTTELDQFAKFKGQSKNSLYQIGQGEFKMDRFKFITSLN